MARELKNKTNVNPPNSEYPYGQIRDDNGTRTYGTPVNEESYGDMQQFFARMFEYVKGHYPTFDYNDNPENAYDGWQFHEALLKTRPCRIYKALLTQAGTAAPTAVIMPDQNTLSGTLVFSRAGVGQYLATLVGAFPDANKTFVSISGIFGGGCAATIRVNSDSIQIVTYNDSGVLADVLLASTGFIIEVYP